MCGFTDKLAEYGLIPEVYYQLFGTPLELHNIIEAKMDCEVFCEDLEEGNYHNVFYELLLNCFTIKVDNPKLFVQKLGLEKYSTKYSSLTFFNNELKLLRNNNRFCLAKRSESDDYYHEVYNRLLRDDSATGDFAELRVLHVFNRCESLELFKNSISQKREQLHKTLFDNEISVFEFLYNELTNQLKFEIEQCLLNRTRH